MMKICLLLIVSMFVNVNCEVCTDTEMVYNGNFSKPEIYIPWAILGFLPGGHGTWSTVPRENGFELWEQGAMGSPAKGVLGEPTGQHLQINGNKPWAQISYEFNAPCLLGTTEATFSFQYWFNDDCECESLDFSIEQEGKKIVDLSYDKSTKEWIEANGTFIMKGCQPLKLTFTGNGQGRTGVHVNNVSLKVSVCSGVEMIKSGQFDKPAISSAWEEVSRIPSQDGIWSTTTKTFTLWKQGAMGSPTKGTKGKPIGQFLELNGDSTKARVGFSFFPPYLLGSAESTLSFLYWLRDAAESYNVNFLGYSIEQDGEFVKSEALNITKSGWVPVTVTLDLEAAKPAHLYFTTNTKSLGGVFIDSVSLQVTEHRDESVDPRDCFEVDQLVITQYKFAEL